MFNKILIFTFGYTSAATLEGNFSSDEKMIITF